MEEAQRSLATVPSLFRSSVAQLTSDLLGAWKRPLLWRKKTKSFNFISID